MGVDFTHCKASWAYSGFGRFRDRLAEEIGMNLREMEGFGGDRKWGKAADPIIPLLNHSDCDGELTVEECKTVAPRLRQLVRDWPDDDYDKQQAMELANGMDEAVMNDEPLIFR